jgi:hypothetical protein
MMKLEALRLHILYQIGRSREPVGSQGMSFLAPNDEGPLCCVEARDGRYFIL